MIVSNRIIDVKGGGPRFFGKLYFEIVVGPLGPPIGSTF